MLMAILRHCLILLLILGATQSSWAQDCGCTDCPLQLRANQEDYELCYDVFNVTNDDLANANQSICQINLSFTHNSVKNLEVSLRSPGNQFIQLIGNFAPAGLTTNFGTTFDVSFIPSTEIASPDPGHADRWTNADFRNAGVNYTGSYYPYDDELEDFNFGTVNGEWCLVITNNGAPIGFDGEILDFSIEFCDETGRDCCFANSGDLNIDDFTACAGANTLALDGLTPSYTSSEPDPAEYDYSYIIARSNIIVDIVGDPDLSDATDFPSGNFTICGLSYDRADLPNLPQPNDSDPDFPYGVLTIQELRNDLNSPTASFCGKLTDECINISIQSPPAPVDLTPTICSGDSVVIGTEVFRESINTSVTLQTAAGCDSLVNLDLTVIQSDITDLTETVCAGESYRVGNQDFNTTGNHEVLLQNGNNCDSLVRLDLTVLGILETRLDERICFTDCFMVGDSCYNQTDSYMNILTSIDGCDSTVFLNLVVDTVEADIVTPNFISCANNEVTLDGSNSPSGANITYEWEVIGTGNISGPTDQIMTQVDQPGTYRLIVTDNSIGGCRGISRHVVVDTNYTEPTAIISNNGMLTCATTQAELDGNSSSGQGNLSYQWQTINGNIIGDNTEPTINIDQPGDYELTVIDDINGCSNTQSFNVTLDDQPPIAIASVVDSLTCAQMTVELDGTGSTENVNTSYLWTTMDGNITANETTLSPEVDARGTYTLTVTNNQNGCSSTSSIRVGGVFELPNVVIEPVSSQINCETTDVQLNAENSDQGADLSINWTTTNGLIVNGTETTLTPIVTTAGTYQLTITNQSTGCSANQSVTVAENFSPPNAIAGNPNADFISCRTDSVRLEGGASSGSAALSYFWQDENDIEIGQSSSIFVKNGGVYRLIVQDMESLCRDTTTVAVSEDFTPPTVDAGNPVELNCAEPERNLDGSNSASGSDFSYRWDGPGIVMGNASSTPLVDEAGTYYLTILSNINGCTGVDSVLVTLDDNLPMAEAGMPDSLTCDNETLQLNGSGSSTGNTISYEWTSIENNPITDPTSLSPTINNEGHYVLTVINNLNQCTATDTVVITNQIELPTAIAGADGAISCDELVYVPDGSNSSNTNEFSFNWITPDGSFLNGTNTLSPVIDAAGTYILEITNSNNSCIATDTLEVTADFAAPTAVISSINELTCDVDRVVLNGENSTGNNDLFYEWSTTDGNFTTPSDATQTTVDEPAVYTLVVTDTVNGCMDSTTVQVTEDINVPTARTSTEEAIDCASGEVNLSGNGSSLGDNFVYEWQTFDGDFETTADPLEIIAQAAGNYTLIVRDTVNNCSDESSVLVTQNCMPDARANTNDTITCFEPNAILTTDGSSQGDNFTLTWLDSLGMTISMSDTIMVSRGGLYILEITSNVSGETDRDSIIVQENRALPIVNAGDDLTLDCNNPMAVLDGTNSSSGANFEFEWTNFTGGFVNADSLTLTPTIDAAGIYNLEILNTENGCRNADAVQVRADETLLEVCLSTSADFNCGQTQMVVDASCSTQNENTVYTWTTSNGNIISGENTLQLTVDEIGIYTLSIEDTANGCTTSEDIEVTRANCDFSLNVSPDTSITCTRTEVTLVGNISPAGDNYIYTWLNSNNEIISQDSTVIVNNDDTYTFLVRETQTNTVDSAQVVVTADNSPPNVNAGQDQALDCQTEMIILDANTSISDPIYAWSGLDNQTIINADSAQINVTETGLYVLEITNPENGCFAADTVEIIDNSILPDAFAGADTTFTCRDATLRLRGEGSSTGSDFIYNWTSLDGTGDVCGQENALNTTICAAGTYQLEVVNTSTGCVNRDTITVAADENAPDISAGDGTTFNCAIQSTQLNGTGPTSTDFSIIWTFENGDTIAANDYQPIVDQAGNYTLSVANTLNGCSSTAMTTIRIDTIPPAIDAGNTASITCEENSTQLNGSVENTLRVYTFLWTGMSGDSIQNDTLLTPIVYQSGVYTLSVIDEINQCESQDSVMVTLDDNVPDAFAGEDQMLTCTTNQIELNGSSTATNVIYQWQDSTGTVIGNNAALIVSQAGVYTFVVVDTTNNCAIGDNIVITTNQVEPDVSIIANNTQLDCNNSKTLLEVGNASANFSYQWTLAGSSTTLGTADTLEVNQGGDYQLSVSDVDNGCTTILTQEIQMDNNVPMIDIDPAPDFGCQTDSLRLTANASNSDLMFFWTNEVGDTLATTLDMTIFMAGEYQITAVDPASGCDNTATITIANAGELPEVNIISTETALTCTDNEIQLFGNASNDLDYEWSDNQGTIVGVARNLNVTTAGQYILRVTNPQTNCSNQDSIEITADEAFINGINISLTEPTCFGEGKGMVTIDNINGGTEPFNYSLNGAPFKSFPQFDFLSPDTYTLTVEDAFGCQRDTTFTINQGRTITVDLGEDQTIQLGDSIQITAQVSDEFQFLEWQSIDTLKCADCPTQVLGPLETTTYSVTVMNSVGCMDTDELTIQVAKERPLYFPTAFSPNGDGNNDIFFIGAGNDVEIIEVMNIYDRWGTLIFSAKDFQPNDPLSGWDGKFDGQELNPAVFVYYAHVVFKDGFTKMITGDVALMK